MHTEPTPHARNLLSRPTPHYTPSTPGTILRKEDNASQKDLKCSSWGLSTPKDLGSQRAFLGKKRCGVGGGSAPIRPPTLEYRFGDWPQRKEEL